MSLLAPRPQQLDRASVVLPTVTCSSCAAPIPLSSLGEHVCRGPVRPSGSRIAQRPSQITIPSSSGPSRRTDPSPSSRPSQVGSSSSTNSPANLAMPPRAAPSGKSPLAAPSPNGLYPSPTPSPRTPSPTNPFFPHPVEQGQRQAQIVHGLGLGVAARTDGPYPNDAPLSAVVPDLSMLDTSSGGNAGMAGVGRRAFAAAAWSVRAGVALASSARPQEQAQPQQPSQTHQQYPQRPKQQQHPGFPQPQPQSRPELEHRAASAPSATLPSRLQPRPEQTTRGSRILPKVPLSGRQGSGTLTNAAQPIQPPRILMPASPPQRSASAMGPDPSIVPSPPGQRSTVSHDIRGQRLYLPFLRPLPSFPRRHDRRPAGDR